MTRPLSLEDAQTRLLDGAVPLASETLPTGQVCGRWLAAPLRAHRTSPAADLSAMDGYACAGSGPWRLIGESAAGKPWAGRLSAGEAVAISTGAHVPAGADAILLREDARMEGSALVVVGDPPAERWIRRTGFDFTVGQSLRAKGAFLGPAQIALALMAGAATLEVGRLSRIAILDTGDELVDGHAAIGPGRIPATNGAMLAAMCAGLAADIVRIGPVPDAHESLLAALEQAGAADVIVTSGGVSVGPHDLVRPALAAWGAEPVFWRVALRPGKPLLVARRGAQTVLGLPGNPASAFVTALLFVLPLLRRLAGAAPDSCLPRAVPAVLAAPVPAGGPRREFLRARWTAHGILPLPERDSSALRTLAAADALIDRAPQAPAAFTGDAVKVLPLQLAVCP